ncbi:MAG: single-stranded-DNA-specific exonuclease RecJ [Hyphomicrobiaceae bacterium]
MRAQQRQAEPASAPEPFLGVVQSARGFQWTSRLGPGQANLASAISERHNLPELLGRVLAARGATLESVPVLLDPTLKALMPDPSSLAGMEKAAERLADAIIAGERTAIFGDYDVDGACSSALMRRFIEAHGLKTRIYIPDRIFEGYGPNTEAIEMLVKEGARLIITVDCGTVSHEVLGGAAKLGAEVVVVDHHQADERLPNVAAIVNPNRQDDVSGQGHLCAAGVVYLLLVATTRSLRRRGFYKSSGTAEPPLLEWLDIVALATVCDVVPLEGLNRAYVVKGLQVMRQRRNIGLRALADAAGLNQPPTPYHLGYVLGPRINAGGRIGNASLGAELLSIDDEAEAARIAALLDKLNKERKAMETEILEQALAAAEVEVAENPALPIILAGSKDWHKGLVGLVASRLTERFQRPACVIAWGPDGTGTGSLRSIAGVDIGAAVRAATANGLLVKGGGHAMAAGLTVAQTNLDRLRAHFASTIASSVGAARERSGLAIDGALTPRSVTADLVALLERAGPYGQGNPTPRFVFPAHRLRSVRVVGETHVRATIESSDGAKLDAIAFRAVGSPLGDAILGAANALPVHVAGQIRRDTWGGRDKTELTIDDIADPRNQE